MFAAVALFSTMRAHWAHYTRSLEFSINGGFNTSGPSRAITAQLQVNPPSGHAGAASIAPQAEVHAAAAGAPVTVEGEREDEVRLAPAVARAC
jgi:hypothetical protein